jgi:hypothetical protein
LEASNLVKAIIHQTTAILASLVTKSRLIRLSVLRKVFCEGSRRSFSPKTGSKRENPGGHVPIRLALLGGTRPSDLLSTISIVKLLVELDLAPLIAQDFPLFGYPLANPSRTSQTGPDFDTSFWKDSSDSAIHFFEQELTADKLDGMIAVRTNEPIAGFQIQVSSRIIATEVLWHLLELPQKLLPLANEPIQVVPYTKNAKYSFANLSHLCPRLFSLSIQTPKSAQSENQISAIALSIIQILLHYRSQVRQVERM